MLVYSLIDEADPFHVTKILPSQSARDLYEAIMTAWVKWATAPSFLLVDAYRSHLARQFIEQLGAHHHRFRGSCTSFMDPWSCGTSWSTCAIHGRENGSRWSASCHECSVVVRQSDISQEHDEQIRGYSPSQWVVATKPRVPESMAPEAQPSPSTNWFCFTANGPVCLDSPCAQFL